MAKVSQGVVYIWRKPLDRHRLSGIVIGYSQDLVLLHILDDNIRLNGYSVVLSKNISGIDLRPKYKTFYGAALARRRLKPGAPRGVIISDLAELIPMVAKNFPLLTIHRERTSPNTCDIGQFHSLTVHSLTLQPISPNAEWEKKLFRCRLSSITKVDFGGEYEEALSLVSGQVGFSGQRVTPK